VVGLQAAHKVKKWETGTRKKLVVTYPGGLLLKLVEVALRYMPTQVQQVAHERALASVHMPCIDERKISDGTKMVTTGFTYPDPQCRGSHNAALRRPSQPRPKPTDNDEIQAFFALRCAKLRRFGRNVDCHLQDRQ
jgi:hypothetical protein